MLPPLCRIAAVSAVIIMSILLGACESDDNKFDRAIEHERNHC